MGLIKPIYLSEIDYSVDAYYFGWSNEELSKLSEVYQHKYFGSEFDLKFEIITNDYESYYAFFRGCEDDFYGGYHYGLSKNHLFFNDEQRVIILVNGIVYRFHLEEKKVFSHKEIYGDIKFNEVETSYSLYFHSIVSQNYKVIILIDDLGIAAIDWDGVLWRHYHEGAYCADFIISGIQGDYVKVHDTYRWDNGFQLFNILTGERKYTSE